MGAAAPAASDPRVQALHNILSAGTPLPQLENLLSTCGIAPVPELVEAVLRLSYSTPAAALRFFRWSGAAARHSAGTWDLMVDILGKNSLFEAMWDAIHSMKRELGGALELPTFVSVFSSYCAAGQFKDAVMSFEVMERYGVVADVVALNALLTAFCTQRGRTGDAAGYLEKIKGKIAPNGETFAILLEGWKNEGNAAAALRTFGEMVLHFGWRASDAAAHNALLVTLISAGQIEETVQFLKLIKANKCFAPGLEVFRSALDVLAKEKNFLKASQLWDIMELEPSPVPDLQIYRSMIVLCSETGNIPLAYKLLDEMPFNGAFPDSTIYDSIFDCHVRTNDAPEAERFFAEMRKNEHVPSASVCASAIRMFFKEFNPVAAWDVWRCVVEERVLPADGCAQEVIKGFLDLRRLTEVKRCLEEILAMGIELPCDITDRVKSASVSKTSKDECYDRIVKRPRPMH